MLHIFFCLSDFVSIPNVKLIVNISVCLSVSLFSFCQLLRSYVQVGFLSDLFTVSMCAPLKNDNFPGFVNTHSVWIRVRNWSFYSEGTRDGVWILVRTWGFLQCRDTVVVGGGGSTSVSVPEAFYSAGTRDGYRGAVFGSVSVTEALVQFSTQGWTRNGV